MRKKENFSQFTGEKTGFLEVMLEVPVLYTMISVMVSRESGIDTVDLRVGRESYIPTKAYLE